MEASRASVNAPRAIRAFDPRSTTPLDASRCPFSGCALDAAVRRERGALEQRATRGGKKGLGDRIIVALPTGRVNAVAASEAFSTRHSIRINS